MGRTGDSLRERTRRAVRAEIVEAAMELFLSQGFDETTVEEIAQAAGISRRSYFRYFASKDEALASGLAAIGASIADGLAARPDSESPWLALRRAFDPIVQQADRDPRAEALGRLMLQRPVLQREKESAWAGTIAAALTPRLPADQRSPLEVEALVASAIACVHVAQEHWLRPGERVPLGVLVDAAMAAVRPLA